MTLDSDQVQLRTQLCLGRRYFSQRAGHLRLWVVELAVGVEFLA